MGCSKNCTFFLFFLSHLDILHSDPMSDVYQRKVTRARQSLNEADNVRSIVRSLRENSLRHQLNPGVRGDQGGV